MTPPGDIGAIAALLALSTGAACCAAWAARFPAQRLALRSAALGIAVVAAALGSTTGLVASAGVRCARSPPTGCGIALALSGLALVAVLVTGTTWAVAGNVVPNGLGSYLEDQLGPHGSCSGGTRSRSLTATPGSARAPGASGS